MKIAKMTPKNQITLPKAVMSRFADVEYFDVSTDGEYVILRPLRKSRADEVRAKVAERHLDERDVAEAVDWARKSA